MIQGRLSPLNLDRSRLGREEISKEEISKEEISVVDQSLTNENANYSIEENKNTLSLPLNPNKDDQSMRAASPNSNSIVKSKNNLQDNASNENGSSFIMHQGKIFYGTIKFFNQKNEFGFIIQDEGDKDLFFHYEDIKSNNCPRKLLKNADKDYIFKVSYQVMFYVGKKKNNYKAINIKIENISERV